MGLLASRDRLAELDADGNSVRLLVAPAGARGWAWRGDLGLVVGERSNEVFVYARTAGRFDLAARLKLSGAHALRDVAFGPGNLFYVADRHRGAVLRADLSQRPPGAAVAELGGELVASCPGVTQIQVTGSWLVSNCLLAHRLDLVELGVDGRPSGRRGSVTHDGPMWAFDATAEPTLRVVIAGVEDHPLDRSDGAFGYIDSFAFVYDAQAGTADGPLRLLRTAEVNLSEHGVVTPKWIRLAQDGAGFSVAGPGGEYAAVVTLAAAGPSVSARPVPGGIADVAGDLDGSWVAADPLLDRWVVGDGASFTTALVEHGVDDRDPLVRLGEALVFTTLMGPGNTSAGPRSRFTCETCHFEGTVDGRVHYTGRGEVHATTKTLRGLFGNRPHFSRALDRTSTDMINNEFAVVSRGTSQDPWFSLRTEDHPWLAILQPEATLTPQVLRQALLRFLITFNPELNPATLGRDAFTEEEARGAALFARECEACHQARTHADDETTRSPLPRWERMIFDGGAIVWATENRKRTGVEPYVHPDGARQVSLRRLWVKRPLMTNGSAVGLRDVLATFDAGAEQVHAPGTPANPLSEVDRAALASFVDLL